MSARAIPLVVHALAADTLATCEDLATRARSCRSADAARRAVT